MRQTTALQPLGRCPVCTGMIPGTPSRKYPGFVVLDYHLHPERWLGFCIGSRTASERRITIISR